MTTNPQAQELPELPPIDTSAAIPYEAIRYVSGYTENYVHQYAIDYAKEAVAASQAVQGAEPTDAMIEAYFQTTAAMFHDSETERIRCGLRSALGLSNWPLRVERLKAAIEGECDGLAISDVQAANILRHLGQDAPPVEVREAMSEEQLQADALKFGTTVEYQRERHQWAADVNAMAQPRVKGTTHG